jgi:hypothetical protein
MHDWKANVWLVVLCLAVLYFVGLAAWGVYQSVVRWAADRWYNSPAFCDESKPKPWYVRRAERAEALRSGA